MNVLCLVPISLGKDKLHIVRYWTCHGVRSYPSSMEKERIKKEFELVAIFHSWCKPFSKRQRKNRKEKKILPYYFDTFLLYSQNLAKAFTHITILLP